MSTLKQLVDETTNIKDELVNCYDSLKNNLTNKNIEILETDKLNSLINKVSEIKTFKKVAGTEKTYFSDSTVYSSTNTSSFEKMVEFIIDESFDSARISYTTLSGQYGSPRMKYQYVRGEEILDNEEVSVFEGADYVKDVENIKKGDKVVFWGKAGVGVAYTGPVRVKNFKIRYSIKILD